ncbi:hypothetical protein M9Y10_045922 [Tritrichomonas musculus]|uniref:DUF3447 domain-containing protein n=1 Tax=Tritrichomonas musculus TaxID=1915356 RepID=A0ABR2JWL8_9EUKA
MSICEYLDKNKNIQDALLTFLENEINTEEDFQKLILIINKQKIINDKHEFTLFLHLLSKISQNHYRNPDFISKIKRILKNFEKDIKKNLTNSEIFDIFKGNKRIILFLFDEKILKIEKNIVQKMIRKKLLKSNYPQYFLPEIKPFISEGWFTQYSKSEKNEWIKEIEKKIPENFNELRNIGENDNYICKLIQNDSIKDFIIFVNKNNYSIQSTIESSIYETNPFLIKKQINSKSVEDEKVSLIEYAAFYGAIQIFKYLQLNNALLTPKLWYFVIHGKNGELIHLLEDNKIKPKKSFKSLLEESIKCHHNDIANYLLDNYFRKSVQNDEFFVNQCFKSYNFAFIQIQFINEKAFFYICKYNYYTLLNFLLNDKDIDVNQIKIIKFNTIQNY